MIKNLTPSLAEAGKIKIGGLGEVRKSKGGKDWRPPVKLDHFLVTTTQRNKTGDLIVDKDLMDAIGTDADGKIRAIPIVLHADEIDDVFPTSYALYTGKKCACRGDGETATRFEMKDGKKTGNEKQIACPCAYLDAESGPKCKPNGKLYCSIMAEGAAIAGAVHVWRTTSIISIKRMIGSLEQIRSICGTLRGIPLWLKVEPIQVEHDGKAATVYCCHVELRAKDVQEVQRRALEAAQMRRQLGFSDDAYRRIVSLPAHNETLEEQAEIDAEFYTEENEADHRGSSSSDVRAELAARDQEQDRRASDPDASGQLADEPSTEGNPFGGKK